MISKLRDYTNKWQEVKNATMTTINKEGGIYPTSEWKRRLLLSEHSPIRKIHIGWKWYDLQYWVSTHFVRHKFGIEHFVRTQRTDRTGMNRNDVGQGAFVEHECEANAQAIITISRKRLCACASPETQQAWRATLKEIEKVEPELVACCVPDCIYRGHCYEFISCGYHKTEAYKKKLEKYRGGINE